MTPKNDHWLARGAFLSGGFAVFGLVAFFGLWGTQTTISGAILAQGQLHVETKRQVIQHPDGGVVGEIHVADGDRVQQGEVLISLDRADTQTEIEILQNEIAEINARSARLRSERDDRGVMEPNPRPNQPDFAAAYATQAGLFLSRQKGHENELNQLQEAVKQTKIQAEGTAAQHRAVLDQIAIVEDEVARQSELETKNLTTTRIVAGAKHQEADLKGRAGSLIAEMARLKSRAAQMEIERSRLMVARKEQAIAALADLSVQLRDANSRLVAAKRRLERLNIVAPVAGIVFDLKIHALRSVVGSGEPLAYVIPQDQALIVTARISESDIDQLSFNQDVNLRFSALDTRFTPTIRGRVERISADILGDEVAGLRFYEADIRPNEADFDLLGDQKLVPGMPVEAYIQTGERTPLAYLVKPLADYFYRAFRHD